jgi:peptide deformylase
MKLKVVQIGDPVLETVAKQVKDVKDPNIQKLIDNMLEVCNAEIERAAGLSAPQVGESLQISICRRMDKSEDSKEWEIMINPQIIAESKETSMVWEGCLSIGIGDNALYGPVIRPKRIKVKYLDREGNTKELNGEDYFSHIIQHELDHLNGVLFIKLVKNPEKNLWTSKELDQYMDKAGDFPEIF